MEGYRICLSYRLLVPSTVPPADVPRAVLHEDLLTQLCEAVREWDAHPIGHRRLILLLNDRHARMQVPCMAALAVTGVLRISR